MEIKRNENIKPIKPIEEAKYSLNFEMKYGNESLHAINLIVNVSSKVSTIDSSKFSITPVQRFFKIKVLRFIVLVSNLGYFNFRI